MTNWLTAPIFGSPDRRFPHIVRPSAYALLLDAAGQLAIVHTNVGAYLPGGGLLDGESAESGVCREVFEECGFRVQPGAWRRLAIDHVTAVAEGTHFEKRSIFCDAKPLSSIEHAGESDHRLAWMPPSQALAVLTPPSHRWAVTEWLADHAPPSRPGA